MVGSAKIHHLYFWSEFNNNITFLTKSDLHIPV